MHYLTVARFNTPITYVPALSKSLIFFVPYVPVSYHHDNHSYQQVISSHKNAISTQLCA
jgi:hypothetical protein